jgi:hypothetical protein
VRAKHEIDPHRRVTCPDCGLVYDGGLHALGICPRCAEAMFDPTLSPEEASRRFAQTMALIYGRPPSKSVH